MDILTTEEMTEILLEYFDLIMGSGFSFGLLLGTALEFLGYGVFKALSLLNIR